MRALLKQILLAALAGLIGLLLFGVSSAESAWRNLGMAVLILAAIVILFSTRDLIHLGLQRWGISTPKDTIFTHLCAGLMLLLALAAGSENDQRLQGAAWWALVVGLPLSVYVFSFLHRAMLRCD
jgi:uncharacterized membrane protein YdcZ (DUF606 family)